jgi:fluoroquinolone transport system permease protein
MNTRLLSTLRWDITLQFRYGFYYVSVFIVVVWTLILSQVPAGNLGLIVPLFLLSSMIITTFYFIGALVLLEKGENALHGLTVTPLRSGEFLWARTLSLTALAMAENLFLILLVYGRNLNLFWLLLGMAAMGTLYSLLGFVAIARYDAINEYLMPSVLFVTLLTLPILDYTGIWPSPVFYLHPVQPSLTLLRAAFTAVSPGHLLYGVIGSAIWTAVAFHLAQKKLRQFIIRAQ